MKKVSIIIPVIRPEKAERCIDLIKQNAGYDDYEIIQEVDENRIGCPKMVKRLAEKATGDLVLFMGDDSLPQPDFLKNAIKAMESLPDGWGLVGFNDKTGRILPTHWLADSRLLILLDGEFFHTGYNHCFCDNELMLRSAEANRYIYSQDAVIEHDHPILRHEEITDPDLRRVYAKDVYQKDRVLFGKRRNNNWKTPSKHELKLGIAIPMAGRMADHRFWLSYILMEKPDHVILIPSIEVYEFRDSIAGIRNDLVEQAIDSGCSHLFMIDMDQVYPANCLKKMIAHNKGIVSAPIHRRYPPFDLILFRGEDGKVERVPDEEAYSGDLISVNLTGTGCILYNMDIFSRVERPWFEIINQNGKVIGEDINFCRKLRAIGEKIFVDTSIRIPHLAIVEVNRSLYELYKFSQTKKEVLE